MKKKLLGVLIGLSLASSVPVMAKSVPVDIGRMQAQSFNAQGERQYDGRLFLEFAKPASSFAPGEAVDLVASLSKEAGVMLSFEKVMMKRFVVVRVSNARSDLDVVSAVSRIASEKGVLSVKPNSYVKTQSATSFVNPGWSSQFGFYSRTSDLSEKPFGYNPRLLELIDFFDGFNFGDKRLSLVDSFFEDVPNMPHSAYVQKQTILDGVYSSDLIGRGTQIAHGLNMAAYLGGKENATYGTVGLGYATLPLLAVAVFDPRTNTATDLDVAEGMLYSMNMHSTADTNPNPNPATVINLSLGSFGSTCSDSAVYQAAIDMITNAGGLVVAAAGNLGRVGLNIPANCENVIAVGAAGYSGHLASFSNRSPDLTVSAISTTSTGDVNGFLYTTDVESAASQGIATVSGTSIAAPYISLLLTYAKAVNPSMTFAQAEALLKRNSIPFNEQDSRCAGLDSCGGIIDPVAFVQEVSNVDLLTFNAYTSTTSTPPDGGGDTGGGGPNEPTFDPVTVSIAGTASNPTDVQVFVAGQPVTITSITTTENSITLDFDAANVYEIRFMGTPNTNTNSVSPSSTAQYSFTVNTTVTPVTVSSVERLTAPGAGPAPAPVASGGGGGGGGSMNIAGLLGMAGLFGLFHRRKKSTTKR